MRDFIRKLFCLHDWEEWNEGSNRWASAMSVFALPGSEAAETVLVERYKNRHCKKCGKYQLRYLGERFERRW